MTAPQTGSPDVVSTLPSIKQIDALPARALSGVALQLTALLARVAARLASNQAYTPAELISSAGEEECYLSIAQLVKRIPYAESTIRNLMDAEVLRKGEHYFKRRGRIMFSWPAMRAWLEDSADMTAPEQVPLVRGRRRAG